MDTGVTKFSVEIGNDQMRRFRSDYIPQVPIRCFEPKFAGNPSMPQINVVESLRDKCG